MHTLTVPVGDIVVGERRREDMGDIGELARSLERIGLLHPIVIDDQRNLVAGGRRLAAAQQLGWSDIEARLYGSLTAAERQEIELEENIRRKDLTPYERSKKVVELVETAARVLTESVKTEPPKGRPPKGGIAEQKLSDRIGIPRPTIREARQHVEAVEKHGADPAAPQATAIEQMDFAKAAERYPFIERAPNLPRSAAVEMAKTLDAAPPEKRDAMVAQAERWCDVQAELEPERRADGDVLQASNTITILAKFNTVAARFGAQFIASAINDSPVPGPENSVAILRAAHQLIGDVLRELDKPRLRRIR